MEASGPGEGSPLREELFGRVRGLTRSGSIDLGEHIDSFPEIEKAFAIPFTEFGLAPNQCELSVEDGGTLKLVGYIYVKVGGRIHHIAEFWRELKLDEKLAEHKWMKVEPKYRGLGVSSALLLRSFEFYKELGLTRVELEASMQTGRWHWARVGFEFTEPKQRDEIRQWAREVTEALDVSEPKLEKISAATQFARMQGSRRITLREIAAAIPTKAERAETAAKENYLDMDKPIPLGQAVMLTGRGWDGHLDLYGTSFSTFKVYADSKGEIAQQALGLE